MLPGEDDICSSLKVPRGSAVLKFANYACAGKNNHYGEKGGEKFHATLNDATLGKVLQIGNTGHE